jgi:hypothetical protein
MSTTGKGVRPLHGFQADHEDADSDEGKNGQSIERTFHCDRADRCDSVGAGDAFQVIDADQLPEAGRQQVVGREADQGCRSNVAIPQRPQLPKQEMPTPRQHEEGGRVEKCPQHHHTKIDHGGERHDIRPAHFPQSNPKGNAPDQQASETDSDLSQAEPLVGCGSGGDDSRHQIFKFRD